MAMALLIVFSIGSYVGAYRFLCLESRENLFYVVRVYRRDWEVTVFKPAAKVESLLGGKDVFVLGSDISAEN